MRLFRRSWVKTTGTVLDSRVRRIHYPRSGPGGSVHLHNYIVELRVPSGETKRLEVEQQIWAVPVEIGGDAYLIVKPDGTKAVFDKQDPRVNVVEVVKLNTEADEERFRQQLKP
jgi:hypothetical protein